MRREAPRPDGRQPWALRGMEKCGPGPQDRDDAEVRAHGPAQAAMRPPAIASRTTTWASGTMRQPRVRSREQGGRQLRPGCAAASTASRRSSGCGAAGGCARAAPRQGPKEGASRTSALRYPPHYIPCMGNPMTQLCMPPFADCRTVPRAATGAGRPTMPTHGLNRRAVAHLDGRSGRLPVGRGSCT